MQCAGTGSTGFQKVPEGSKGRQCTADLEVQQGCGRFWRFAEEFGAPFRFRFNRVCGALQMSKFNKVPEGSSRFNRVAGDSGGFDRNAVHCRRPQFNTVPGGSGGFQRNALQCSGSGSRGFREVYEGLRGMRCSAQDSGSTEFWDVPHAGFREVGMISRGSMVLKKHFCCWGYHRSLLFQFYIVITPILYEFWCHYYCVIFPQQRKLMGSLALV